MVGTIFAFEGSAQGTKILDKYRDSPYVGEQDKNTLADFKAEIEKFTAIGALNIICLASLLAQFATIVGKKYMIKLK